MISPFRTRLLMSIYLTGGAGSAWPTTLGTYFLPFVTTGNSGTTRIHVRRIELNSSIINSGVNPVAVLVQRRANATGNITNANFLNQGTVNLGSDIYLSHIVAQTQNGATVNTPDTKNQPKDFEIGELLLTSSDALGIFFSATNATDHAAVILACEFQTEY